MSFRVLKGRIGCSGAVVAAQRLEKKEKKRKEKIENEPRVMSTCKELAFERLIFRFPFLLSLELFFASRYPPTLPVQCLDNNNKR